MKRSRSFLAAMLAGVMGASTAASAQSNDGAAILEALKGIGDRLERMEKRIDRLEGSGSPPAGASMTPPTGSSGSADRPATATLPPGMRAVPGWVINVLPNIKGNREPDALFRFSHSRLQINFNAHLPARAISDWVKYRGEGVFQALTSGRYVISLEIKAARDYRAFCGGYLKIGKNILIDIGDEEDSNKMTRVQSAESKTLSGGISLDAGAYDLKFLAACHPNCTVAGDRSCREAWHATSFDIQIRGPSEDAPRPFAANELFHLVRERRSETPAPPTAGAVAPAGRLAQSSTPGASSTPPPVTFAAITGVRTMIREVNVRSGPSTGARLAGKLAPGQQVRLVAVSSDGEWHRIALGDRVVGFVKTTALFAASQ